MTFFLFRWNLLIIIEISLVALSAKIGLFGGAFINNLRRQNRPRSLVNTGIVSSKTEKVHFSATKSGNRCELTKNEKP